MATTNNGRTVHLPDFKTNPHFGEPQYLLRVDRLSIVVVAEHCGATVGMNLQVPYLEFFAGNASILQRSFQLGPLFILHDSTFLLFLSP
jgi:hypothetical protein